MPQNAFFLKTLAMAALFAFPLMANAANVTVSTLAQLQTAIDGANEATTIEVTDPLDITALITIGDGKDITLTGEQLTRGVMGNLITVSTGGSLTLENITIDGNKDVVNCSGYCRGALVYVNGGALTMNSGAALQNNKREDGNGAGVRVNNGIFTMNSGRISGNDAFSGMINAGGVAVSNSTFTMNGGEISNNTAFGSSFAGGVHIANNSTFTMTGGKISNNIADADGGGMAVYNSTFNMTGGEISNNMTYQFGGGVCFFSGTFTVGGTAKIFDNTSYNAVNATPNVDLLSGTYITISTETPPASGMNIGVSTGTASGVIVESGADLAYAQYFASDESGKMVRYSGGQLVLSSSEFHGGGTEANPYLISTAEELAKLAELVNAGNSDYNNKYYKLLENIDLGVAPYNEGEGWVPIGSSSNGFYGSFNGNGKTISNLFINRPGTNVQGLFGGIGVGMVKNLGIVNVDITGGSAVGGIAGSFNNGIVQNCYTTGTVTGTNRVGGLVGEFDKASVTNSYSTAAVNGNSEVGGLVGNVGFLSISITNCAALNAEVNGSSNVGRIMNDEHGDATLSNSFAYSGLPGTDGTDITATDIITDGTIGGLFTAPVWTTENGKLPGFGTAVDMPAHITVDIANAAITLNTTSYTYSGTAITPNITVTLGGMELTENTHYSITSNNVNAGGASFSIAGMHPFTGTKAGTFTISKATPSYTIPTGLTTTYGQTLADVSLPAGWSWVNATASVGNPGPQIHKANYNPDPSNYNTITGIDVAITVDLVNLANATITHNATYIYDGSGKVLNITVTLGGMILELGQHYDINSITNNINSGEASFTIEGLYPFTGTKSGTFEIAKGTIGGTVSISGKADFGETLTAVTTGVTPATGACSAHSYQWKRNGIDIPYGTNASYEIDEIHFNDAFTVTVFSSDTNCTGAVTSAATTDIVTVARGKVEGTEWSYNGGDTLYISGSGNITWTAASHWSRYSNSIKTVIIGNGLTSIVVYAFGGFSNLTDLVIPDGVVIIYDEACYGCSSLKSITIPGSVTQINSEAFYNCSSLEEAIFLGDAPTDFSKINVFGNTASNFKIYYYVGTSGWTTPTWNGYPTEMLKYAAPSAPGAPTLVSKTHNTITLEANASHEFSKDGTTWQTSNVFSSLSSSTAHTFYQRIAETATNYASAASVALNETTTAKPDPAYTIPTGLTAKEGQKLSEITLPPNWHWMNETESVGTPGTQTHKAKFVPEDTENYNTIENIDVKITVSKELVLIPTTSHSPLATSQPPKYYTLKGTPLGTTKPTAPGVYIVKIGTQTNKIMVK